MAAWKAVSRSAIQHHVLWYNGSGPPPAAVPVTSIASLAELMAEVAKIAPAIAEDRARLVIDCRSDDAARAETVAREALQRLRESADGAEMRVLLYGAADPALAAGATHIHVSAEADVLDRFVTFRGLLVGQKGDSAPSLSLSVRRVAPLSPKAPPPADPPPLAMPEASLTPAAPATRSPRAPIDASASAAASSSSSAAASASASVAAATTTGVNALSLSQTRFGGFSQPTGPPAKPAPAPLSRTPSTTRVAQPKRTSPALASGRVRR